MYCIQRLINQDIVEIMKKHNKRIQNLIGFESSWLTKENIPSHDYRFCHKRAHKVE